MGSVGDSPEYDVLVIGAGLSGCYSLYRLRKQNIKVLVLEAGDSVGGTWYWNRYPGARFDSESTSYGFSFSQEVLDEWDWTEQFSPQPETERYINFICDKFDLRRNMRFGIRIKTATWNEQGRFWSLVDSNGQRYTSRFLVTAMGVLCDPTLPNVPGVDDFKGEAFHTARWPHEKVSFEGKKVGIIGTGATAIQTIPEIAKTAEHLTVFQRTPNWAVPLHNAKITTEEMTEIRKEYPKLFELCAKTRMCFIHDANFDSIWEASPEEREQLWEHLYAQPGFGMWLSNYKEILVDQKANDLVSEFVAKKIRQRVNDPETAEKLVPKNHGFGTRRVPMETSYFEAYNRPNVQLVDLLETPIKQIKETGLETTKENHDLDMLIYATGFNAVTGSFDAIDFTGVDGVKLREVWDEGPRTYLGFTVQHFPNMFMVMGPHQAYGNIPRSVEYAVEWISNCIEHLRTHDLSRIEPTSRGVAAWTEHVHDVSKGLLANEVDSWMTGVNKNVAHKQKRIVARYSGSAPEFRERTAKIAKDGYSTFSLA
ncbi:hypothetical protein BDY17DRAFT_341333 [Neohortaea acidophila]|uniref:Cyclohexanone monooxygenase n=1 Tax=Neohortaea acidophila TaxID=245834 RepID=A0A6A6PIM9_9PEZI|nr:uncharacterized protein BDY17DRAFT_341333 [Neohortaea acidophila]KAF2479775.1 hypothetical protein BDY17DRAFT_341333 [Neohortaea acidophila]